MTSSIGLTIAPNVQMNSVLEPSSFPGNHITGLVGTRDHLKAPSTVFEHLWHERKPFQPTMHVESSEDLFLTAHLNHVAYGQFVCRDRHDAIHHFRQLIISRTLLGSITQQALCSTDRLHHWPGQHDQDRESR